MCSIFNVSLYFVLFVNSQEWWRQRCVCVRDNYKNNIESQSNIKCLILPEANIIQNEIEEENTWNGEKNVFFFLCPAFFMSIILLLQAISILLIYQLKELSSFLHLIFMNTLTPFHWRRTHTHNWNQHTIRKPKSTFMKMNFCTEKEIKSHKSK